ncbi:MAG: hypothetical protein CFE23_06120 [Flavobacterium sp. BFFFF1]|uniref:YCF48-related protein n=1 Tax=Flavobacterium sp. BFFFF1 TaxID=2015557 RepID=UPI000BD0A4C6|nr:YCF48-related protein [Flavobacterium sp. BFFFF1]OYU81068.1 MAG: hypothetical protein CFE23_06120 [Flavobacterium sp. BFFFF1]
MKRLKLFFVSLIFLTSATIMAQWVQKPSGTNDILTGVHFPSANVGFVVGIGGTILKTTDIGETWNTVYSNANISLKSVYFINESVGFAVGNNILKTIDGGNSWEIINSTITDINKITFTTDQIGFLSSSTGLYKTTDGGNNWALKSSMPCMSMSFPSQNVGYIHANSNSIFKTIDGGETWTLSNPNANPNSISIVSTLFFTTEDKGFFGGYYYAAFTKTTDGGTSWNCINTDCQADLGVGVKSIYFSSNTVGYAVSQSQNNILKTMDGGETWTSQNLGTAMFYDIYFTSDNVGFVVGGIGEIFKTTNGGSLGIAATAPDTIAVYPNPTADRLKIEVDSNLMFPIHFKLNNTLGENLIDHRLLSNSNTIELSDLSKGVYLYQLLNANNEIVKIGKIIKE